VVKNKWYNTAKREANNMICYLTRGALMGINGSVVGHRTITPGVQSPAGLCQKHVSSFTLPNLLSPLAYHVYKSDHKTAKFKI